MNIRPETEADHPAVHAVNVAAFGTPLEAGLVDVLREQADPAVSLVADEQGTIVGHIFFSPVVLEHHPELRLMGLGPMAVAPARQRTGIGSALVAGGLDACRQLGIGAVVVLGHPAYYPRFGFAPAIRHGIGCEYDVPEDTFMVVELERGYLQGVTGRVSYHPAFGRA